MLFEEQIHNSNVPTSLLPVFNCKIDDVSNGTYYYDVYWYINGNDVKVVKNAHVTDISSTVLREKDWKDKYRMNMQVTKRIRYDAHEGAELFRHFAKFVSKYRNSTKRICI